MFKRKTNYLLAVLAIILTPFFCFIIERGVKASWTFEVEQRSQGKQRIHVSISGDRLSEGWYEATENTITPLYAKHLGAGDAIGALYLAAAMTGIICLVFFALFKLYQRWLSKT